MNISACDDINDLRQFDFIRFIRRRKTDEIVNSIIGGITIFLPQNNSLPIILRRSDILNHLMKQMDGYRYKSISGKIITVFGNEIRTGDGFRKLRVLSFSRHIILTANSAVDLFAIPIDPSTLPKDYELRVVLINAPFQRGILCPYVDEQITFDQMSSFITYINLLAATDHLLLALKSVLPSIPVSNEIAPRQSMNSLHVVIYNQESLIHEHNSRFYHSFRETIIEKGRVFLQKVTCFAKSIISKYSSLNSQQRLVIYSLHHCILYVMAPTLFPTIIERCVNEIADFDSARMVLSHTSLSDLHLPDYFACNFTPVLAQFNCAYFEFNYHPETALPLSLLQCWHQLLTDIRFGINTDIQKNRERDNLDIASMALSTDDLISIVIFILIKSNLSSSIPAHFLIIDAFSPCELSCSVLGYAYGIMETATMWIVKQGKEKLQ